MPKEKIPNNHYGEQAKEYRTAKRWAGAIAVAGAVVLGMGGVGFDLVHHENPGTYSSDLASNIMVDGLSGTFAVGGLAAAIGGARSYQRNRREENYYTEEAVATEEYRAQERAATQEELLSYLTSNTEPSPVQGELFVPNASGDIPVQSHESASTVDTTEELPPEDTAGY